MPADSTLAARSPGASLLAEELYGYLDGAVEPAPHQRVYVNRTLRMESIHTIGFDLDWTLADYRRLPFDRLTFDLALRRLLDHHGYPESARQAEFRPDFPRRSLLIDKDAGTVLRMSRHRFVNLAYFGRQRLDRKELRRLYRYEPVEPGSDRFYHLDSLFELPEANLFSEIVEQTRHDPEPNRRSYREIFQDVRNAIDWVHAERSLKSAVLADPERYLERDPLLALALARLQLGRRRLFLLTNSGWDYAAGLCSFLFDGLLPGLDSWRQLFDLVIVNAGKPDFFRLERPFESLDDGGAVTATVEAPAWGGVYRGGNLGGLMRCLQVPGEQVLYVGDHIYGDAVSSKQESTWRIALIVRELEEEIRAQVSEAGTARAADRANRRVAELGRRLDHARDLVTLERRPGGHAPGGEWKAEFDGLSAELPRRLREAANLSEPVDRTYNPYWGSLFKQGASKTRFAAQLESYACLYTSRVRNFVHYGSQHYYRVLRDPMMHELEEPAER